MLKVTPAVLGRIGEITGCLVVNHGSGAWFDLDNNPNNGLELILAGGTTVEERINRDLKLWGATLDSTSYQLNNAQITTPVTGTVYTLSDGLTTVITTAKSNSLDQLVTDLRNADKYSDLTFTISADTGTGSIVATNGENATETVNAKNATITTGRIAAESLIDERLGINPQFGAAAIQVRDPGGVLPAYQNELILSAEQPGVLVKENPFEYPYGSTAIAPIYTVPSPTSNAYTYSDNVYWMDWNEDGKLELPLAGSSER